MPEAVVILGTAGTVIITALAIDFLKRGGEAWWWRQLATLVQRARRRYHGWKERRRREGIEAGLDKVAELVSRTEDCKASHPEQWPLELKDLWSKAATQMIDREVGWRIEFAEYAARVWVGENVMHVWWPDLTIHGRADARRFDAPNGSLEIFERWDEDTEAAALR